jgi:hypothetical protein
MPKLVALRELLDANIDNELEKLFKSFSNHKLNHDIEDFLVHKAIQYEKQSISRTSLVFEEAELVGYFAISNKSFIIEEEEWRNLSNSTKRKIVPGISPKNVKPPVQPQCVLIGQLGKNYATANSISGSLLLRLAEAQIYQAHLISGGHIVWLECEDNDKLLQFYQSNGYLPILKRTDVNGGLVVMIKKVNRI